MACVEVMSCQEKHDTAKNSAIFKSAGSCLGIDPDAEELCKSPIEIFQGFSRDLGTDIIIQSKDTPTESSLISSHGTTDTSSVEEELKCHCVGEEEDNTFQIINEMLFDKEPVTIKNTRLNNSSTRLQLNFSNQSASKTQKVFRDLDQSPDCLEDAKFTMATLESIRTESLTPLVKEELRCHVQIRRLSNGQDISLTEEERSQKTVNHYQPTPEDLKRREKRKISNKESARRCRSLRKQREITLQKNIALINEENANLTKEIVRLRKETNRLRAILENETCTCLPRIVQQNVPPSV